MFETARGRPRPVARAESAEINSQCLFARAVFYQAERPPEPPPLNTLRVPSQVLWFLTKCVMMACRADSSTRKRVERLFWSTDSPFVHHTSRASTNLDENDEYVGTTLEGRSNTFSNWKKSMTTDEKRVMVLDFLLANQDEEDGGIYGRDVEVPSDDDDDYDD